MVHRLTDGAFIPADPDNSDYTAYLAWLGAGNKPEPADPVAPQVPQQVTRAQGKVVLIQMGLWSQVLGFVAAITDPVQKALAEVALHDTQFWQRTSPFLQQASQALGMTEAQLDDLFIQADQVVL